jgi:septal ring factor EnvC (AmiA/AmiB activator)
MNAVERLQKEMAEEKEAVRAELIACTDKISAIKNQMRESVPPTTSAGRAKRRDQQEELADLQAEQDRLHHLYYTAIQAKYQDRIDRLKDKLTRLEIFQKDFDQHVRLGMWETMDPHALVRQMRPLAQELEVDLVPWLEQYDYTPEETPQPAV